MKKVLSILLIAVLIMVSLVACGGKESAEETKVAAPEQAEQVTEPATEVIAEDDTVEETEEAEALSGLVVTPATVSVVDSETGVAVDITYNSSYYSFEPEVAELPLFLLSNSDSFSSYIEDFEEEYPDMDLPQVPLFECMIDFKSEQNAQDFWDSRYEAIHGEYDTGNVDITEMTTMEVDAGTFYMFDEFWTSDNDVIYRYAILEYDFGSLIFHPSEYEEVSTLDIAFRHFFIDAALAG